MREQDYRNIGIRIHNLRKLCGLSQAALAERAELSTPYISHIERGMKLLSLPALLRIAEVLDIPPGTLLNDPKTPGNSHLEFAFLLDACSPVERQVIYDLVLAAKESMVRHFKIS